MKERIWKCNKCGWVGSEALMIRTWIETEGRKIVDLICPRNTKECLDHCGNSDFETVETP